MRIAYLRVSTQDQKLDRQQEALDTFGIERWFEEKVSGKDTNRPQLTELRNFVRSGDEVYVEDWSRLSRSVSDLLHLIEEFSTKNVRLVSLKENFDTSTPTGKLLLTLISAINQFEREVLLERQREGIEIAKKKGVYKGRRHKEFDVELLSDVIMAVHKGEMTKTEASRQLGVTRGTVYNILKRERKDIA